MKRIIKFRGKRLDNGEWVFGDFCHHLFPEKSKPSPYISYPNVEAQCNMYIEVDPNTVGQFTGLYDNNGKEVYEGDILNGRTNKWRLESKPAPHDYIGYVRWEGQCDVGLQWVLTTMDSTGSSPLNWYVHCCAIDYSTGIVIGSIHDNPDLLNGK